MQRTLGLVSFSNVFRILQLCDQGRATGVSGSAWSPPCSVSGVLSPCCGSGRFRNGRWTSCDKHLWQLACLCCPRPVAVCCWGPALQASCQRCQSAMRCQYQHHVSRIDGRDTDVVTSGYNAPHITVRELHFWMAAACRPLPCTTSRAFAVLLSFDQANVYFA